MTNLFSKSWKFQGRNGQWFLFIRKLNELENLIQIIGFQSLNRRWWLFISFFDYSFFLFSWWRVCSFSSFLLPLHLLISPPWREATTSLWLWLKTKISPNTLFILTVWDVFDGSRSLWLLPSIWILFDDCLEHQEDEFDEVRKSCLQPRHCDVPRG